MDSEEELGPSDGDFKLVGKRRATPRPNPPLKQLRPSSPVIVSNKFTLLPNHPSDGNQKQEQISNKVPPIHINGQWPAGVESYKDLVVFLKQKGGDTFTLKSNTKGVVLYPDSPTAYRTFVRVLAESGSEFHTYQLPEDKLPTVVIRGLHPTTPIDEIKNALSEKGYNTLKITNALDRFKKPMPLFFVQVDKETYNDKIYDITNIFYTKIRVEEPKKKKQIAQCSRCQRFGHTKAYCTNPHRCIRCGQLHPSVECKKNPDTAATCANCGNGHPANYKGCSVLKELRTKKNGTSRIVRTGFIPNRNDFPSLPTIHPTTHSTSLKQFPPANVAQEITQLTNQSFPARNDIPGNVKQVYLQRHQYQPATKLQKDEDAHLNKSQNSQDSRPTQQPGTSGTSQHYQDTRPLPNLPTMTEDAHPLGPSLDLTSILAGLQQLLHPLFSLLSQLQNYTMNHYTHYGH